MLFWFLDQKPGSLKARKHQVPGLLTHPFWFAAMSSSSLFILSNPSVGHGAVGLMLTLLHSGFLPYG